MQLTDQQKENIKLWLAALRSGEYKQATGVLNNGNGFCCLGVACDVYAKQTGKGKWGNDVRLEELPTIEFVYGKDSYGHILTDVENIENPDLKNFFGIPLTDNNGFDIPPFILNDGKFATKTTPVTELNDSYELTFEQIADLVEKYILNGETPMTTIEVEQYLIDRGIW